MYWKKRIFDVKKRADDEEGLFQGCEYGHYCGGVCYCRRGRDACLWQARRRAGGAMGAAGRERDCNGDCMGVRSRVRERFRLRPLLERRAAGDVYRFCDVQGLLDPSGGASAYRGLVLGYPPYAQLGSDLQGACARRLALYEVPRGAVPRSFLCHKPLRSEHDAARTR